jgi:GWxTD domain-containing protein
MRILTLFCFLAGSLVFSADSEPLSKGEKEFLSQTRYIITKEEEKLFKSLSQAERPAFIEEFWKKRDPEPETEENYFKELYFSRMAYANERFRAGKPGWLTDRGRIYILLGQPDYINENPTGRYAGERPSVVWTYDQKLNSQLRATMNFSFVDLKGTNDYQLVNDVNIASAFANPTGTNFLFPSLYSRSDLQDQAEMAKAQKRESETGEKIEEETYIPSAAFLSFDVKARTGEGKLACEFTLDISDISFSKREEDGAYIGSFDILFEVTEATTGRKLPDRRFEESFVMTEAELSTKTVYAFTKAIDLARGSYQVVITVTDVIAGQEGNWMSPIIMP